MNHHYEEVKKVLRAYPKKWLVTGGAGFIGSHLLEELVQLGQEVVCLDDLSTGKKSNIPQSGVDFIHGDITSLDTCLSSFEGVDIVLHQAAISSVPMSVELPIRVYRVNTSGSLNVLVAAVERKVGRVVYASSSAVYGNQYTEECTILAPLSPYAASKASVEAYAHAFCESYGLTTVGLRYFNVYGPRQNAGVIHEWLKIQQGVIYGDGTARRDFCFVKDVVQANILAATTDVSWAEIFNVATGVPTSLNDLYGMILTGGPRYLPARRGEVAHSMGSTEKARRVLNYEPQYPLDRGIALCKGDL